MGMSKYTGYNPDWGKKATAKYIKDKLKTVNVRWKKDYFDEHILPAAEKSGLPLVTFIKQAVEEKIERDS